MALSSKYNIYYKLVGKQPVPCDIFEFSSQFEDDSRQIKLTEISPDIRVSTVFLGIDHSVSLSRSATPILFETMVFEREDSTFQARYATYEEAEAGHEQVVSWVKTKLANMPNIDLGKVFQDERNNLEAQLQLFKEIENN